jgi:hypothetical protein
MRQVSATLANTAMAHLAVDATEQILVSSVCQPLTVVHLAPRQASVDLAESVYLQAAVQEIALSSATARIL